MGVEPRVATADFESLAALVFPNRLVVAIALGAASAAPLALFTA